MELFEATKKGHCAICGAKIKDGWYAKKPEYEDGTLYKYFTCCACGYDGEDIYNANHIYIGTNGWVG